MYLEDLGPIDLYLMKEEEIEKEIEEEDRRMGIDRLNEFDGNQNRVVVNPVGDAEGLQHQQFLLSEMAEVESKIIWELENWKKTEEAKYRYSLRQREIEFLQKQEGDWQKKELEREKHFKDHETKLVQMQTKLKNKVSEQSKREQKIILLEEELKQKIIETGRQMANKDEENDKLTAQMTEEKVKLNNKVKDLEHKLKDWEKKWKEREIEFEEYKKIIEDSPVQMVKNELQEKVMEIAELRREQVKTDEVKEEYKKNFDRMKNEIIHQREEKDNIMKNTERNHLTQMEYMRNQLAALGYMNDATAINNLKADINNLKMMGGNSNNSGTNYPIGGTGMNYPQNPGFNNIPTVNNSMNMNPNKENSAEYLNNPQLHHDNKMPNMDYMNEMNTQFGSGDSGLGNKIFGTGDHNLDRLLEQKQEFGMVGYSEDDPFMKELNSQINTIRSVTR